LDVILATAGVTMGALYYQVDNKKALGHRVVDEIVASLTRENWVRPLQNAKNPIDTLIPIVQSRSLGPEALRRGCPRHDLSREMLPLDAGFHKSFLAPVPIGRDHVDEIHKTQEKWNGAGTFGFLVTLNKHERRERRRGRIGRIELPHRL
jgi:AcrR family transcriptional regulator